MQFGAKFRNYHLKIYQSDKMKSFFKILIKNEDFSKCELFCKITVHFMTTLLKTDKKHF